MTLALIARFQPLHVVHAAILTELGRRGPVLVGVGSANRHDARNPFSCEERTAMIHAVLGPTGAGYGVVPVEDLGDGPRWARMVAGRFGPLDAFVSANPWVRSLLRRVYPLVHPRDLVAPEHHAPVDGTLVRRALARGEAWRRFVPPAVADLMDERGLPERFRRAFGLETLAADLSGLLPAAAGGASHDRATATAGR